MKFHRRKTLLLAGLLLIIVLATGAHAGGMEVVQADGVSIVIGGVLQAGFEYYLGDDERSFTRTDEGALTDLIASDRNRDYSFTLNRFRLRISGSVLDSKVKFATEFDFAEQAAMTQMVLELGYLPYTWVRIGKFIPELTLFGAEPPEELYLIDYPLMDEDPYGNAFHDFEQIGLELQVDVPYLRVRSGLFNGQDADDIADNNTAKDIFVALSALPPVKGFKIQAAFWYALKLNEDESITKPNGTFSERNDGTQSIFGGIRYTPGFGPIIAAEIAYRIVDPADPDLDDHRSVSYNGLLGIDLWRLTALPVQLLGRYDFMDPDVSEEEDEYSVITGGFNYSFEGPRARLSLNYIHRIEMFDVQGKDGDKQTGFEDNELKLQVQASF